ncbi:hypothetical protein BC830DRAFT_1111883 [Chytriomyces sp. MP71]|nr:hypothetical protein BC830DRAFT_1111883 [Chytriomyces sp. MP71]
MSRLSTSHPLPPPSQPRPPRRRSLLNHLEAAAGASPHPDLVPVAAIAGLAPNKENRGTPRTATRRQSSQPTCTAAVLQMRSLRSRSILTSAAASAESVCRFASTLRVAKRSGGSGGGLVTAVFGKEEKSGRGGPRRAAGRAMAIRTVRIVLPSSDELGMDESEDGEETHDEEDEEDQKSHFDSLGGRYRLRNRLWPCHRMR